MFLFCGSWYVAFVLWFVILSSPWQLEISTQDALVSVSILRVRSMLWDHYREHRKIDPSKNASGIHDLTTGMIGTRASPVMHRCGGAEIRSLLPFVLVLLSRLRDQLPSRQTRLYTCEMWR